jgi:hypothetical protein
MRLGMAMTAAPTGGVKVWHLGIRTRGLEDE